ncbi:MAG TPA: hypothetical protein VM711_02855 [Sphingomicrobium sp.]|nr:hypothetical protein [Sphingomicrobium sp.]
MHDVMGLRRTMLLFDDFQEYISGASNGSGWTSVLKSTGTAAVGDGFGGILTVTSAATLNDDNYVKGSHQIFGFAQNKPFMAECYLQYSEANTNKANVVFGFMSGVAAGAMQDTTGEPKTSFSGAVIYKVPGGTQWKTASSVGTTQTVNQSDTTAGGSAYTRLLIQVLPVSSTLAEVTYFVDGVQLKTSGGRPGQTKIKDQLTYTGSLAFSIFFGIKPGSGTGEVLNVDYCGAELLRALFTGF